MWGWQTLMLGVRWAGAGGMRWPLCCLAGRSRGAVPEGAVTAVAGGGLCCLGVSSHQVRVSISSALPAGATNANALGIRLWWSPLPE